MISWTLVLHDFHTDDPTIIDGTAPDVAGAVRDMRRTVQMCHVTAVSWAITEAEHPFTEIDRRTTVPPDIAQHVLKMVAEDVDKTAELHWLALIRVHAGKQLTYAVCRARSCRWAQQVHDGDTIDDIFADHDATVYADTTEENR